MALILDPHREETERSIKQHTSGIGNLVERISSTIRDILRLRSKLLDHVPEGEYEKILNLARTEATEWYMRYRRPIIDVSLTGIRYYVPYAKKIYVKHPGKYLGLSTLIDFDMHVPGIIYVKVPDILHIFLRPDNYLSIGVQGSPERIVYPYIEDTLLGSLPEEIHNKLLQETPVPELRLILSLTRELETTREKARQLVPDLVKILLRYGKVPHSIRIVSSDRHGYITGRILPEEELRQSTRLLTVKDMEKLPEEAREKIAEIYRTWLSNLEKIKSFLELVL